MQPSNIPPKPKSTSLSHLEKYDENKHSILLKQQRSVQKLPDPPAQKPSLPLPKPVRKSAKPKTDALESSNKKGSKTSSSKKNSKKQPKIVEGSDSEKDNMALIDEIKQKMRLLDD